MQGEDLRADMAMQTSKTDARCLQNILHAFEGEVLTHGEAELGILTTCADELMRIGFHARGNTHIDILRYAQFLGDGRNATQLNTGVDNNAAHAGLDSFTQFLRGFIVAMNNYALSRETRSKRAGKLAATGNIEAHAVLVGELYDSLVLERFGSIGNFGTVAVVFLERLHVFIHAGFKISLVKHVQCSTEFLGHFHHIAAADEKMIVFHFSGKGQNLAQFHGGKAVSLLVQVRYGE